MGASGDRLDDPAIPVAGLKVLLSVNPRGVLAENRFDPTALLEEGIPVNGRKKPKAEHTVADRNLVGRHATMLAAEDLARLRADAASSDRSRSRASVAGDSSSSSFKRRTTNGSVSSPSGGDVLLLLAPTALSCSLLLSMESFAHRSARRCSSHSQAIFSARRRRFSSRTKRSIVGNAQSSPMVSGVTSWNARTNRSIRASSSSLSV